MTITAIPLAARAMRTSYGVSFGPVRPGRAPGSRHAGAVARVRVLAAALAAPLPAAAIGIDEIAQMMSSADVEERREGLGLLIGSGALPWEGLGLLRQALTDPAPGIRREAVEAAAMLGPDAEPTLSELETLLRDPPLAEQAAAAIEVIAGSGAKRPAP